MANNSPVKTALKKLASDIFNYPGKSLWRLCVDLRYWGPKRWPAILAGFTWGHTIELLNIAGHILMLPGQVLTLPKKITWWICDKRDRREIERIIAARKPEDANLVGERERLDRIRNPSKYRGK